MKYRWLLTYTLIELRFLILMNHGHICFVYEIDINQLSEIGYWALSYAGNTTFIFLSVSK